MGKKDRLSRDQKRKAKLAKEGRRAGRHEFGPGNRCGDQREARELFARADRDGGLTVAAG